MIQALDSEVFYNFVSSSDHRSTWRNRAKSHLGLSCHRITSSISPRVWLGLEGDRVMVVTEPNPN